MRRAVDAASLSPLFVCLREGAAHTHTPCLRALISPPRKKSLFSWWSDIAEPPFHVVGRLQRSSACGKFNFAGRVGWRGHRAPGAIYTPRHGTHRTSTARDPRGANWIEHGKVAIWGSITAVRRGRGAYLVGATSGMEDPLLTPGHQYGYVYKAQVMHRIELGVCIGVQVMHSM